MSVTKWETVNAMTDCSRAKKPLRQLTALESLNGCTTSSRLHIQVCPCATFLSLPFTIHTVFGLWLPFVFLWRWVFQKAVVQAVLRNKVLHALYLGRGYRVGGRSGSSRICISKSCKTWVSPQARYKMAFSRSVLPRVAAAVRQDTGLTVREDEGYE